MNAFDTVFAPMAPRPLPTPFAILFGMRLHCPECEAYSMLNSFPGGGFDRSGEDLHELRCLRCGWKGLQPE